VEGNLLFLYFNLILHIKNNLWIEYNLQLSKDICPHPYPKHSSTFLASFKEIKIILSKLFFTLEGNEL
jgi:hypothetical protein